LKVSASKVLHLPIKFSDGMVMLEFGGPLPLKEGEKGELVISAGSIDDPALIDRYTQRNSIRLLPQGAELLVMLSNNRPFYLPKELEGELKRTESVKPNLGKWFRSRRGSATASFVSISIGPLFPWQDAPDGGVEGGLWLELEGPRSIGLVSSEILLPKVIEADPIKSLNHAFTVLSENFEPQRISHTGNVYEHVLYLESDGLWYPLKLFRDGHIAKIEQGIAHAFWKDLKARLSGSEGNT
jgi:hypothetical protein